MPIFKRSTQHDLLKRLQEVYPQDLDREEWEAEFPEADATLLYLKEHKLVRVLTISLDMGPETHVVSAQITAKGHDFIEQDGGLTAILGVMTFRLHDDTLKTLIEKQILAADLPAREKNRLIAGIQSLAADSTKHLARKLLDKTLENGPATIAAVESYLRQALS